MFIHMHLLTHNTYIHQYTCVGTCLHSISVLFIPIDISSFFSIFYKKKFPHVLENVFLLFVIIALSLPPLRLHIRINIYVNKHMDAQG